MTRLSTPVGVFLDRDGVINRNQADYVKSWAEFQFLPGTLEALTRLAKINVKIVVVTNQSAIGRGLLSQSDLEVIHSNMLQCVGAQGGRIDAIFYCPHHPNEGCDCRKPQPGLLIQAAERFNIDLSRSYFVGDAISDLQASLAAGCSPIFVLSGRGSLSQLNESLKSHCEIRPDLSAAVNWILKRVDTTENFFNETSL